MLTYRQQGSGAKAKRLILCCPVLDKTVHNFLVTPSTTFGQFFEKLRAAFGMLYAWPWDTSGCRILDINKIFDGQRVLLGTDYFQVVLREEEALKVMFWEEAEETFNLPGAERYMRMLDTRRIDHAEGRTNIIRITLPLKTVTSALISIWRSSHCDEEDCKATMTVNWAVSFAALWDFNPKLWPGNPEESLLRLLLLLSEMTIGQALPVRRILMDVIKKRSIMDKVPQNMMSEDVEEVITWLVTKTIC